MEKKIKFIQDPGHGWISVPRNDLKVLGIEDKISQFSYQKGNRVYLEEDCDAPLYMKRSKEIGCEIILDDSYSNKKSWIRYQERYKN